MVGVADQFDQPHQPGEDVERLEAGIDDRRPVTGDELDNRDDLEIGATINGEVVQQGRTSQLIFPVPTLVATLSETVELFPGDVVFTGTPAGVGAGRTPPRFLEPGDVLRSYITGIGELEQTFVDAPVAVGQGA